MTTAPHESTDFPLATETSTRLSAGGRVVIPAEFRKALGLKTGDELVLRLQGGEIRLTTRLAELRRAQQIVARYAAKSERSWVDELIAERRDEAARE